MFQILFRRDLNQKKFKSAIFQIAATQKIG
jgi:hypothetical protein